MDDLAQIVGTGPVLVLSPHPDDETLGCGALLAACWSGGISAHVACLTDGAASHLRTSLDLTAIRAAELRRAIVLLGGRPERDLTFLEYPDAALHRVDNRILTRHLGEVVDRTGARVLLSPSPLDPHCDHVATANAAECLAEQRPDLTLLFYPIWSRWAGNGEAPAVPRTGRTQFDRIEPAKAAAIAVYESQQGRAVQDDGGGFAMPPGFAEMFAMSPEIFDRRLA